MSIFDLLQFYAIPHQQKSKKDISFPLTAAEKKSESPVH